MKRRDLFKAAPAVALFALPAMAASQSPIMELFQEWKAAMDIANDITNSADVAEAFCDETRRLEDLIANEPAQSAQDVAAKVIAWTGDNQMGLDGTGSEVIWKELRALVA